LTNISINTDQVNTDFDATVRWKLMCIPCTNSLLTYWQLFLANSVKTQKGQLKTMEGVI